ncbi:major facilitator superfamily domain-containing protein [Absidia repens]|uniref:Major facilitator superfamily domain-containing protein n=1 Tax=Absidia repens TaxID=90262 RepID=A0A1X2IMK1_9FUNG|nr:major facilitator superfamily domain-containing protein [Absidia repens]
MALPHSEKDELPTDAVSIVDTTEELRPPDGGRGWIIVLGSFLGLFAIFGNTYSWGLFLSYYNINVFPGNMNVLSWIGSICVALFFILGPVNQLIIEKMGYKYMLATGTVLCTAALILASFATQVWHVFLTQGVLLGFGSSFVWFPCIGGPQQWFSERRGLAVGISMAGSGIGGLVIANICQAVIDTPSMGYRWALRIDGIICFVLLSIATFLVRPLGTAAQTGGEAQKLSGRGRGIISWYLFKNSQFCVLFMVGLITTFGYMAPSNLLPSHAKSMGLNPWVGANLSAIMSAINACARVGTGYMGDKLGRFNSLCICAFLAGVSCLAVWMNVHNEATLWAFAVLYGIFSGGYVTFFPTVQPQVVGLENISPAVGLLYLTNTFGYLFGVPIATALMNKSTPANYQYAAAWSGSVIVLGSFFAFWLRVQRGGWAIWKKV